MGFNSVNVDNSSLLSNMGSGIKSMFSGLGDFMSSDSFSNSLAGINSLANLYGMSKSISGMDKSLDIANKQFGIMKNQEQRAANAQQMATDNSLSLALQMTTPGTTEHEALQKAVSGGNYNVANSAYG
ncbi:MAG: hypothetical protein GY820_10535 [Gammaproteobacteria bacterium]|nr:hypothetical protein [Gammaproteobacteria bacterium]